MFECKLIHIEHKENLSKNWVTREQGTEYPFPLITDADSSGGEGKQCGNPA
jgi:hypothetical protein